MTGATLSIQGLRGRLPLLVFVLFLVFLVVALGLICLCTSDHPSQAVERSVSAAAHAPALVEMWAALLVIAPLVAAAVVLRPVPASGRASPAQLQRFLF